MSNSEKPDPGIFIVKGDIVGVDEFTISVDENGKIKAGPVALKSGIDMTPYWLNIAFEHLKSSEGFHKKLMLAKENKNDNEIGTYLKKESSSGMQAIVSAGIAIDAYYASIKDCVSVPDKLIETWRDKRTARHKQISEVLRLAFPMSNSTFKEVRQILKQNITWRDKAVHPISGTTSPTVHVELNKATDWRYATFRFYNAKTIYELTLSLVYKTATNPPKDKHKKLQVYCDGLLPKLKPWVNKWERKYGKLL